MEELTLKIRIAVLWIFMAVAMSAHMVLLFMEPGVETLRVIEEIMSAEYWMGMDPGQVLFVMSLFWLVPLMMAFLSLTLKDSANRWTNMILGLVFTVLNILHLTEPCAVMVHQKLIIVSTIVVTALVVWYAWKWPKQKT